MNKKNINNITVIVGSFVSVILGAGFISGQEILFFFARFKFFGIITMFFTCILFSLVCGKQLLIIKKKKIKDYNHYTTVVMGKIFSHISENISLLFMFVLMSTMFSAGGATINEAFGLGYGIGVIIISILILLVLILDLKWVLKINTVLAPFMIIGGILVGLYTYSTDTVAVVNLVDTSYKKDISILTALFFGILYASYNSITSTSLLSNMGDFIDHKKSIIISSALSGMLLFLLGASLILPIAKHYNHIFSLQIPMMAILKINKNFVIYIYLLVLLSAIFTTAISSGISIVKALEKNFVINHVFFKFILVILAVLMSQVGFSNFVSKIYPLFGIFGLFQMLFTLKYKIQ